MKLWKEYLLTEKQALSLGFKRCACGIIHEHNLYVERFWIWVRFKGWSNKPFTPLRWIYKRIPKREEV